VADEISAVVRSEGRGGGVTGSLQALRRGNSDRLIQLLRENGPLHRAELARRAGLSRASVTNLVADLMRRGLVVDVAAALGGGERRPRGRAGELVSLNAAAGAALGIDYSKGEVRVVVANLAHELSGATVERLDPAAAWPQRLKAGLVAVRRALDQAGVSAGAFLGAGLGIPDPIDLLTGTVGRSTAGPSWTGVRAADEFARRLGMPVALDNTARLAALAELMWGAGAGARNAVYVKMSHGVGAGLLFDYRILRGAIGAAGELGHVSVDYEGPVCACGNRGCLELYAAAPAILAALQPVRGPGVTLPAAIAAARRGDRACARVIGDAGRLTGQALANVCNLLNPELIIVGGELADAGDILLDPIREAVSAHALSLVSSSLRVVPAKLGSRAGAMGGVALVLREADRLDSAYLSVPRQPGPDGADGPAAHAEGDGVVSVTGPADAERERAPQLERPAD
jgi:predicted NBD/HSP70 family sugar kinase